MSSPSQPPKSLSSFKQLHGGAAQAIAAGEPLAVLGGSLVTWWAGDSPVEVALPSHVDPYGARWAADRKSLRVGLGAVDVATKAYRDEPALQTLNTIGPGGAFSVRRTAWFGDGAHVAIVVEMRDPKGGRTTELAVADTGGRVRGRSKLPGRTGPSCGSSAVSSWSRAAPSIRSTSPRSRTRVRDPRGALAARLARRRLGGRPQQQRRRHVRKRPAV